MYPKLRFKGFDDAWEQRKLSDIYQNINNAFVGIATPYYVTEGHFYLESNNVKDGQINRNTEVFINDEFYQKQKDKWLHTGDMVMVQSGHVGHAAVIPEELDNTAAHALIMFKNPKTKIDPYFLNYQYQTHKSKKKIENITTGNTIKHILASDMQEFIVDLTNYEEQSRIADFFKKIDNLIALHQRQCEALKKQKRFFLQNMFPKEGESEPRIRFNGFTEPWEQRKCKTLCSISTGKSNTQDQVDDGEYPFFIRSDKAVKSNKYLYDEEAVITFGDCNIGKVLHYVNGKCDLHQRCYKKTNFIDVTAKYFYYYFSKNFYKRAMSMTAKATVDSVRLEMIADMDIQFPTDMSEQKLIADYFTNLDNLITLHQRQYEQLVSLKKYLLSKMFI